MNKTVTFFITLIYILILSTHAYADLSCTFDCPNCEKHDGKLVIHGEMAYEVTVTGEGSDNPSSGKNIVILKMGNYEK